MPELPEVETTKRGIQPWLEGQTVERLMVRESRLRWPIPDDLSQMVVGRQIQQIARRGKYILLDLGHGSVLIHLGMSGSLRILQAADKVEKHDHVDMLLSNGRTLRYNDPRRFGCWLWAQQPSSEHKLLASLGPEPLTEHFQASQLWQGAKGRRSNIKSYIMDSHVVVGVGNIYANEALFIAGIHPKRAAGKVSKARYGLLVEAIKAVLSAAIEQGGTTLKDFVGSDGKPGYFKQELKVYGRQGLPCGQCQTNLTEIRIANRSTVYCRRCQR